VQGSLPRVAMRETPRNPPNLAAVIIARNEEENVARCVESVLRELRSARAANLIDSTEVLVVDSASTDRTVEIALRYPIRVLRLPKSSPLSAAAGRFTGFRNTSASLVFFLDGDEELVPGWLPKALELIRASDVGTVSGHENDETVGNIVMVLKWREVLARASSGPKDEYPSDTADSFSSGLAKRQAIESVGGIQPFLKAAEDRDLGFRLRQAGWRILFTSDIMAKHRWSSLRPMTYMDYFRSVIVWSLGDGQLFRLRFQNKAVRDSVLRRYLTVRHLFNCTIALALISLGAVNVLSAFAPAFSLGALGVDVSTFAILDLCRRRRRWSWRELAYEFHNVPYSVLRYAGFLFGVLKSTPPPSEYPLTLETVRASTAL